MYIFLLTLLKVESFILDQEDLDNPIMKTASELLLSSATDGVDLRTVDPETQARLEALLEAAGMTTSSNLYWDLVGIWALLDIHAYLLAHSFWHRLQCVTLSHWGWRHTCWLNLHEARLHYSLPFLLVSDMFIWPCKLKQKTLKYIFICWWVPSVISSDIL